MAEIEESWGRVTAWLAVNAPASYATLRPPALTAELDACERDLGLALPVDLRRLLLVNNGTAAQNADGEYHRYEYFLPGGHWLLSAVQVARHSRLLVETMRDLGFASLMGSWWHPQWVLFASNVTGDGMAIDQRPGPGQGTVGEFDHEGSVHFTMGSSLAHYFGRVADALESRAVFEYFRPFVDDAGGLDWDVTDALDED